MTDHMNPVHPPAMQQQRPLSPMNNYDNGQPPPKRPRLNTEFPLQNGVPAYGPPIASPGMGQYGHSLPPSPFSSFNTPLPIQPFSAIEPTSAFPRASSGSMGPPEKPKADKATDINDLSDLVNAAGVDLKAEESYLTAVYKYQRPSQATTSFSQANSFYASQDSSQTLTPESSFNQWSQSPAASQLPLAARPLGPLSQPAVKPDEFQKTLKERQTAARTRAQASTSHLRDPFLLSNTVRERIHRRTYDSQVRLEQDGYQLRNVTAEEAQFNGAAVSISSNEALVSGKIATLTQSSSLSEILALISLATQERIRSTLEDSYGTARSRLYGSNGVVPPEWADIATGATKSEQVAIRPESITGTAWDALPDSAVSPMTVVPSKRTHDDQEKPPRPPTPPLEPETATATQHTIRFPSQIPSLLVELGNTELAQERKRLEARKKRRAAKEKKDQEVSASTPDTIDSPAALATPTSAKELTAPSEIKMTKKERERQKNANNTEEVLRKQANATANMALGRTSKKYSWLNKANTASDSGSLVTGAGQRERLAAQATGAKKPTKPIKPTAPTEDPGLVSKKTYQQMGLWKEAPDIELRDLVTVLERETKERKALLKAYQRLAMNG